MAEADRTRWNDRHRARPLDPGAPDPFVLSVADQLPTAGRALDLAGGRGRHAIWLARRGLDVTLADISEVAIERALASAREAGVALRGVQVDLALQPPPAGPWDVIVCVLYLDRPLLAGISGLLAPEGRFIFVQPTRTNLQRHPHAPRFVLEPGEVAALLPGLRLLIHDESWDARGQHEARVLAGPDPPG